jgi:hypothetical protein
MTVIHGGSYSTLHLKECTRKFGGWSPAGLAILASEQHSVVRLISTKQRVDMVPFVFISASIRLPDWLMRKPCTTCSSFLLLS